MHDRAEQHHRSEPCAEPGEGVDPAAEALPDQPDADPPGDAQPDSSCERERCVGVVAQAEQDPEIAGHQPEIGHG
jgi:hypothetical protein